MTNTRRTALTAVVGSLVVLVLGAGVLAAVSVEAPLATDHTTQAEGDLWAGGSGWPGVGDFDTLNTRAGTPTTTTPTPGLPAPTAPPARGPTTTQPLPPASGEPTGTESPVRSGPEGYGPASAYVGKVDIPFTPGQTSWTGVSNGANIAVRTDNARPREGDAVRFDVEVSSPGHACCGIALLFGDGALTDQGMSASCPDGGNHGPGPVQFSATHTYNLHGRWMFSIQVVTGNCQEPWANASLFGTIEIAPGTPTAQGPFQPTVFVGHTSRPPGHDADFSWASVVGWADDEDGWITTSYIDWGDGTPNQPVNPAFGPCTTGASGWPRASHVATYTGEAIHHYDHPGTYTIVMVVISTACDGTMPQSGARSTTWLVPASA